MFRCPSWSVVLSLVPYHPAYYSHTRPARPTMGTEYEQGDGVLWLAVVARNKDRMRYGDLERLSHHGNASNNAMVPTRGTAS
jgi:hypothetical protein